MKEYKFRLKKDIGKIKAGEILDCFGGIVSGVVNDDSDEKIDFTNKDYFELV